MAEHADSIAFLIALVGGYLIGSIPFGLLLTKAAGLGDIRQVGSGNIGATNVLRTGRKGLAAATLILDGLKGAVAVLLARQFLGDQDVVVGTAAVLAAFAAAPLFALVLSSTDHALMALLIAVLVFWRHEANIRRLLAGTEPRIGKTTK